MNRDLDKAEATFWLLDKVCSMNFVVFAEGTGKVNELKLTKILQNLKDKHPMLNICIKHNSNEGILNFNMVSNKENSLIPLHIENWENLSHAQFREKANQFMVASVMQNFEEGTSPLIRCGLLKTQEKFILFIVFHHSIADGMSGLEVLREIFGELSSLETKVIPLNTKLTLGLYELLEKAKGHLSIESPMFKPSKPLAFFKENSGMSSGFIDILEIPEDQTTKLREFAKKEGTTMHGAIAAAILTSLAELEEGDQRLSIATPADMRKMIGASITTLSLYITVITTTLDIPTVSNFWDIARNISTDVHKQISENPLLFYENLPEPKKLLIKENPGNIYKAIVRKIPHTSVLSNAGNVSDFASPPDGSWNVDRVAFSVHPSSFQMLFVTATTYKGKLNLTIHTEPTRWSSDSYVRFKEGLQKKFRKEAGVA